MGTIYLRNLRTGHTSYAAQTTAEKSRKANSFQPQRGADSTSIEQEKKSKASCDGAHPKPNSHSCQPCTTICTSAATSPSPLPTFMQCITAMQPPNNKLITLTLRWHICMPCTQPPFYGYYQTPKEVAVHNPQVLLNAGPQNPSLVTFNCWHSKCGWEFDNSSLSIIKSIF